MKINQNRRIVITGIGLTSPLGNSLKDYRENLLYGKSGVIEKLILKDIRVPVGESHPPLEHYLKAKQLRKSTRVGSFAVFCAREALHDADLKLNEEEKSQTGVFLGVSDHGIGEAFTEHYLLKEHDFNIEYTRPYLNPWTIANNPSGEVSLNLGITGPHYTLSAACASGNLALINAVHMLKLGEVGVVLAGGVSSSILHYNLFAAFKGQGALASHPDPKKASRPFDKNRNGVVISEGGAVFVLEVLENALKRGAHIYGEIVGWAMNSDAYDLSRPLSLRQSQCMQKALNCASLNPDDIDLISTHATATVEGDIQEINALKSVFGANSVPLVNNTKSMIGHTLGAAGALELAGNLPSFKDNLIHPTINMEEPDPECYLPSIVNEQAERLEKVNCILSNSFGMMGTNSAVIIKRMENDG